MTWPWFQTCMQPLEVQQTATHSMFASTGWRNIQRKQHIHFLPSLSEITDTMLQTQAMPPKTETTGKNSTDHICYTKDNKNQSRRCGKDSYSHCNFLSACLLMATCAVAPWWSGCWLSHIKLKCDSMSLLRAYCVNNTMKVKKKSDLVSEQMQNNFCNTQS